MSTVTSSWADLPSDLLGMISKCLKTRVDNSRIRSVCTTWRSSIPSFQNPIKFPLDIPIRMFDETGFCITEKTIYCLEPVKKSSSSVKYWLICVEEVEGGKVHLLNPFTGVRIKPLPPIFPTCLDLSNFRLTELQKLHRMELHTKKKTIPDTNWDAFQDCWENIDVWKVVFLPHPTKEDEYLLVVLSDGMMYFYQYGSITKEWDSLKNIEHQLSFFDIVNYKGNLCAIKEDGEAIIVDTSFNVTKIAVHEDLFKTRCHLIESLGELFVAIQNEGHYDLNESRLKYDYGYSYLHPPEHSSFKVFKLNDDELRWIEVTDIGDRVFFTSNRFSAYWSFSLLSSQVPICLKNCVVFMDFVSDFTDLDKFNHRRLIVSHLGTGKLKYINKFQGDAEMFWPPPNWLKTGKPSKNSTHFGSKWLLLLVIITVIAIVLPLKVSKQYG